MDFIKIASLRRRWFDSHDRELPSHVGASYSMIGYLRVNLSR